MLDIMRKNASGWIVKILFAVIIVVFVFAFGMSGLNSTGDPVLAKVGDQVVTRAEFETVYQRMAEAVSRSNPDVPREQLQSPEFRKMVLGDLLSRKLLLAEAEKLGIAASDKEVFAGIAVQKGFQDANGRFDKDIYAAVLRQNRMTPAQFEADFKQQLIMSKVKDAVASSARVTAEQARQMYDWVGEQVRIDYIQVKAAMFVDDAAVSGDEVNAFYEANKERFKIPERIKIRQLVFTPVELAKNQAVTDEEVAAYYAANQASMEEGEQVKARHILVMVKDTDPDSVKTEAKKKIEMVLEKAKSGEDFAKLAQEYSEGPTGPSGGDLGWFGRGAMVPAFEEAAFGAAKGDIVGPVKSRFGWHVIKVEDRKEGSARTLDDAKDEIRIQIAQEKASEQVQDLLDQSLDRLVSGMTLEDIAKELGLEVVSGEPMPADFLSQAYGVTPEVTQALKELAPGKAYESPVNINGGYMLVEKVEDVPAAYMEIDKVTPAITNLLKNQKTAELAGNKADEIHKALIADPVGAEKTYERKIAVSEPFDRQGNITGLGASQELAEAVFAAKDTAWLPDVYVINNSAVIARLDERIPASEATWEQQKDFWMEQAGNAYKQEMLAAYMDELSKNADIEITRPDLLQ
ncbi:peptidylprolyl isomerase [Pseudodesulfovibrio portus]|uniref:Periplasmic chaperone PpiD n=1 Tax=Pseudodesulfovibrio portus TaxID=231439 RepID=A0ABM8ARN9_9BACT|nr:peptidylprolyl isomerase [Pseudodesulfovibrio portus]BDQ34043.1 peptidylprolyl isomerase [Pseudodesulfovibrio portus]